MPPRVAALVPSATEWMYALGLDARLVGVTSACSVPERARREKPILARSLLDGKVLPAAGVDAAVAAATARGEPLHGLDAEALRAARPDLLLVQRLCDVCAPAEPTLAAATRILGEAPRVLSLDAARLDEALSDGLAVAAAAGDAAAGVRLVSDLRARLERVREAVAGRPRPRVAILEWTDPPMRAGHWLPDVVAAAGGVETLGEAGGRSVRVGWEDVAAARPDVVLVAPCAFPLARAVEEARTVKARLRAPRVVAVDADRALSRGGPELVATAASLAALLHPEAGLPEPDPGTWAAV